MSLKRIASRTRVGHLAASFLRKAVRWGTKSYADPREFDLVIHQPAIAFLDPSPTDGANSKRKVLEAVIKVQFKIERTWIRDAPTTASEVFPAVPNLPLEERRMILEAALRALVAQENEGATTVADDTRPGAATHGGARTGAAAHGAGVAATYGSQFPATQGPDTTGIVTQGGERRSVAELLSRILSEAA
jgi:hypothetical protein